MGRFSSDRSRLGEPVVDTISGLPAAMLLNPRRYGDGAKDLWITLNTVQENVIRGGQRDYSRRRPDGSRMPKESGNQMHR
jgi:hypothetical protein